VPVTVGCHSAVIRTKYHKLLVLIFTHTHAHPRTYIIKLLVCFSFAARNEVPRNAEAHFAFVMTVKKRLNVQLHILACSSDTRHKILDASVGIEIIFAVQTVSCHDLVEKLKWLV